MSTPRFPEVTVRLIGTDGNAFAILGKVRAALKRARVPAEEVEEFTQAATAGDYNDLLRTCMEWVEVE